LQGRGREGKGKGKGKGRAGEGRGREEEEEEGGAVGAGLPPDHARERVEPPHLVVESLAACGGRFQGSVLRLAVPVP
jgi:hypothetical protein